MPLNAKLQSRTSRPQILNAMPTAWRTCPLLRFFYQAVLICDSVFFFQRRYVAPYRHVLSQRFAKYAKVSEYDSVIF